MIIISSTSLIFYKYRTRQKEVVTTNPIILKKKESKETVKLNNKTIQEETYKVDIKGEVINPGIYSLTCEKRVMDVIATAGGLTENADTSVINLSKKITDEMVIIVYSKEQVSDFKKTKEIENQVQEKCQQVDENAIRNDACINTSTNSIATGKININTASLEELVTLPGIGESKARDIIKYREANGGFKALEELKNISGIGDNILAQIKENITM